MFKFVCILGGQSIFRSRCIVSCGGEIVGALLPGEGGGAEGEQLPLPLFALPAQALGSSLAGGGGFARGHAGPGGEVPPTGALSIRDDAGSASSS